MAEDTLSTSSSSGGTGATPRPPLQRTRLTARELLRKLLHMSVGLIAFLVVFLGPFWSAVCAVTAIVGNIFILPRIGGRHLWREAETASGRSVGMVLYPVAVLLLILVFWRRIEVAAAVWGILAFGDGMASVCGMLIGGPRLPWNPRKSWAGSIGYWFFGTVGAFVLLWWTLHHLGQPLDLPFLLVASAITALCAAIIESQPLGLDDNLSVPLLAGLVLHGVLLTHGYWAVADAGDWLRAVAIGLAVNAVLAIPAYLARSVDLSGAVGGLVIGTVIWASLGWQGFLLLLAFFVLGTGATKLGYKRKAAADLAQESGGRRSARHAFANTGVAAIAAFFAATTPFDALYLAAFAAAFATATGDTLSSEIGQLLGRRTFLVTTLKPVPRGTEGAVSLEGTLAGLLGSAAIAGLGALVGFYGALGVALVTLAAFVGTTLESVVGATLEKRGLLDNESVNFLNTLIGALVAVLLVTLVQ